MTTMRRYADYSFWTTGVPKSLSAKKTANYRARIQAAAAAEVTRPLQTIVRRGGGGNGGDLPLARGRKRCCRRWRRGGSETR
jgi:hypothetical protein